MPFLFRTSATGACVVVLRIIARSQSCFRHAASFQTNVSRRRGRKETNKQTKKKKKTNGTAIYLRFNLRNRFEKILTRGEIESRRGGHLPFDRSPSFCDGREPRSPGHDAGPAERESERIIFFCGKYVRPIGGRRRRCEGNREIVSDSYSHTGLRVAKTRQNEGM